MQPFFRPTRLTHRNPKEQTDMKVINLHNDENEWIALALENNRHAQHQLYTKFAPKMLGVCRQYCKDLHQAEDIMITAFMKVFANLKHFQHKGSFEGWIRRIMVNECISFLRVQKKVRFMDDETYFEETHNQIESQLTLDEIQFLIDQLPDGYKMVFNLYCVEGYKHQEIAQLLNISEGTSKSQLSHARKMLQQQLNLQKKYTNGTE